MFSCVQFISCIYNLRFQNNGFSHLNMSFYGIIQAMSIFLFLKQIIDIFYRLRFADYCMAIIAVILILVQLWLNRPDKKGEFKIKLLLPDICILILSAILIINMVIQLSSSANFQIFYMYGKVGSAILLYLLGRLCYKRIDECHFAFVSSSYIVVYSNLIYRIINLKEQIFTSYRPDGDLYYYDTDMAFSIIMAFIFLAILGRNTIIKFITIFLVCPFMVFHSQADVQKILLLVLIGILLIYMGERAVKKRKITDFILPLSILAMIGVLIIIILPAFTGNTDGKLLSFLNEHIIETNSLMNRYTYWQSSWSDFSLSSPKVLLIGSGIGSSLVSENAYLSILFSTGIIGLVCALIFVLSISGAAMYIEDRPIYYITVMLAILFLGSCINKNGIEFTQMSWFTMLFFGMGATISANHISSNHRDDKI